MFYSLVFFSVIISFGHILPMAKAMGPPITRSGCVTVSFLFIPSFNTFFGYQGLDRHWGLKTLSNTNRASALMEEASLWARQGLAHRMRLSVEREVQELQGWQSCLSSLRVSQGLPGRSQGTWDLKDKLQWTSPRGAKENQKHSMQRELHDWRKQSKLGGLEG